MNQRLTAFSVLMSISIGICGCNQTTAPQAEDPSPQQDTTAIIPADCSPSAASVPCALGTYSYLYSNFSGGPNLNDYSHETAQVAFSRNLKSDTLAIHQKKKIHQLFAGPFVTPSGETVGFRTVDSIVLDTFYQSSQPIDSLYPRIFTPIDSSTWIKDSVVQFQGKLNKISLYRRIVGGQASENRLVVGDLGVVAFRFYATNRMGLVYSISWNLQAINGQKIDSAMFNGFFNGW